MDRFSTKFKIVSKKYPGLKLVYYRPHTPLFYWLSGGLKWWNLIPEILIPLAVALDKDLMQVTDKFGSFVDIELIKNIDI